MPSQYGISPIPWGAIERYAVAFALSDPGYFHEVIRALDDWHLTSSAQRMKPNGATKIPSKLSRKGTGAR